MPMASALTRETGLATLLEGASLGVVPTVLPDSLLSGRLVGEPQVASSVPLLSTHEGEGPQGPLR